MKWIRHESIVCAINHSVEGVFLERRRSSCCSYYWLHLGKFSFKFLLCLFKTEVLVANTSSYNEIELNLVMRNIRAGNAQCPLAVGVAKLLVLSQLATEDMAEGNCKPYCRGLKTCGVTKIKTDVTAQKEQHTFLCRCHGAACKDISLWLPQAAAINPMVAMEICDVRVKYKWY